MNTKQRLLLFLSACIFLGNAQVLTAQNFSHAQSGKHVQTARKGHRVDVVTRKGPQAKDSDKTYITLEALYDYGDGTGYQIVLDKDHTAGNNVPSNEYGLNSDEFKDDADFSVYEYTIPANATGSYYDTAVVMPGHSVTIEIEPGIYDFFVTNPSPKQGVMWIVEGEDARGNDIVFEAGKDYIFSVTDDPYEWGNAYCIARIRDTCDIVLEKIVRPVSSLNLGEEEAVSVQIKNMGTQNLSSFTLTCLMNDLMPVVEEVVLEQPLRTNQSTVYTFNRKFDMSAIGKYSIEIIAEMEGENHDDDNSVKDVIWHYEPVLPPFICKFDNKEDFETWKVFDGDNNGDSWRFRPEYSCDESDTSGCVMIFAGEQTPGKPEHLLHIAPFRLQKGKYHISYFFVAGAVAGGNTYYDYLKILYGTSPDIEQMQVLAQRDELFEDDWTRDIVNFEIEEDSLYYFAFSALNPDLAWTIYLDNFELNKGEFAGAPDLELKRLFLPISSCELDAQSTIGVQINNIGYGDVHKFTLHGIVSGEDTITETFTRTIQARTSDTVYFTQKFDLSEEKKYRIEVSAAVVPVSEEEEAEEATDNNAVSGSLIHFSPAPLPFHTDFMVDADRENWSMEVEGAWQIYDNPYDPYADHMFWSFAQGPLYSRCIEMKAGKQYRFRMNYAAGIYIELYHYTAHTPFAILCGKSNEAMSAWDTVAKFNEFTNEFVVNKSCIYTAPEDGTYVFSVVVLEDFPLRFKDITITEVLDYDLRMADFGQLPRYIPVEHINSTFEVGFDIENSGTQGSFKSNVEVWQQGEVNAIGGRDFTAGEAGTTVNTRFDITPENLKIGDEVTFTATAGIGGMAEERIADENALDNTLSQTLTVTDITLAYENLTDSDCLNDDLGVGPGEGNSMFGGSIMYFPVTDTLTAVSVMWGKSENARETGLVIRSIDTYTGQLGNVVYEDYALRKNTEAGEQVYEIPARIVESGYYLVMVKVWDYSLICELDPFSTFYVVDNGRIYAQAGMGIPGIRIHYGHNAVLAGNETIAKADTRDLSLYPNPTRECITIRPTGTVRMEKVSIYNTSGREIYSTAVQGEFRYNVAGLPAGLYFARVTTSNGIQTLKFTVR